MAVLERVNRLAQVCREVGIPVFHARHKSPAGADSGVLGEIFPIVRDGFLDPDSHTAAFHDNLVRDPRDILLEKPHFGAFQDTDLEMQLRARRVDTIIITGIETKPLL